MSAKIDIVIKTDEQSMKAYTIFGILTDIYEYLYKNNFDEDDLKAILNISRGLVKKCEQRIEEDAWISNFDNKIKKYPIGAEFYIRGFDGRRFMLISLRNYGMETKSLYLIDDKFLPLRPEEVRCFKVAEE